MNTTIILALALALLFVGTIGKPSPLDKPVNTATVVFLTGVIIFGMALLSL